MFNLVQKGIKVGGRGLLTVIEVGAGLVARAQSSTGGFYNLTMAARVSHLYCDCPSWKFQRLSPILRTCKHLRAFEAEYGLFVLSGWKRPGQGPHSGVLRDGSEGYHGL